MTLSQSSQQLTHYFDSSIDVVRSWKTILFSTTLVTLILCLIYFIQPRPIQQLTLRTTDLVSSSAAWTLLDPQVSIVTIDDSTLEKFGQWPWPRSLLANLLEKINSKGPRAVGIDLLLPEKDRNNRTSSNGAVQDNDQLLSRTLTSGPFVLGYEFVFSKETEDNDNCKPQPVLPRYTDMKSIDNSPIGFFSASGIVCNYGQLARAVRASGFMNGTLDKDGVFRRLPLLIDYNDSLHPSLALTIVNMWSGGNIMHISPMPVTGANLTVGNLQIPLDDMANIWIAPPILGANEPVSARDVLEGNVASERFTNRIVLIGITASGLVQHFITPWGESFTTLDIYRQVIENCINSRTLTRTSAHIVHEVLATLVLCFLLLTLAMIFRPLIIGFLGAGLSLLSYFVVILLCRETAHLYSFLLPVSAVSITTLLLILIKYRQQHVLVKANADTALSLLQSSENDLRSILQTVPDIIFRLDSEGKLTFISPAIAKYQTSKKLLIGSPIMEIVYPEDRDLATYRLNERRTGERSTHDLEIRLLLHKDQNSDDKDIRYFSITAEGMYRQGGKRGKEFLGTQGIVKDINDKKYLEIQLLESKKLEAIGNLAAGVAHDLNNILGGLVSYPDLLLKEIDKSDPLYDKICVIQKSGKKAAAIVQDLLTLARRNVNIDQVCDLNTIISDYLKSLEFNTFIKQHPLVNVHVRLANEAAPFKGSDFHLAKVVMNLINNSLEAMPYGGELSISTERVYIDAPVKKINCIPEGEYIRTKFSDTGVGISTKDMESIFDPFYSKKVMGTSGTGLGMTIVNATIQDHLGFIDISSTEGDGTTISLYLPISFEKVEEKKLQFDLSTYRGDESILVVDDVKEQRDMAEEMLNKLGYKVRTAASGNQGLELLQKEAADLVVLDMIMPGGYDGLETYEKIIELYPGQKVIIASGLSDTIKVQEMEAYGVTQYIQKPFSMERFGVAVRKELDKGNS